MKLRPVCWPTVLITDWMSALTKLTVIFSSPLVSCPGGCWASAPVANASAAKAEPRKARNFVTY